MEGKLFGPINKQWSDWSIVTKMCYFDDVCCLDQLWVFGGSERADIGNCKTVNAVQIYDQVNKTLTRSQIKMIQAK